jgi:aspartate/methionine/tyrosine aminotransferase
VPSQPSATATVTVMRPVAQRMSRIAPFRVVQVLERAAAMRDDGGPPIITLCVGEPDQGTPRQVLAAGRQALERGDHRYTNSLGITPLRERIAAMYGERYGAAVDPARVVVTAGASGALTLAAATLIGHGDELVLSDPGYPCNRVFAAVVEADVRAIAVNADTNFQLTAAAVRAGWGERTRAVLLSSPSNPTGTCLDAQELRAVVDTTESLGGTAIVDEIYSELVYDTPRSSVLAATDAPVVINSFSKTWGMTGWRLGWMVCPEWMIEPVQCLAGNVFISPSSPAQWAALACFEPEVWDEVEARRAQFQQRRDVLVAGLRQLGFGVPVMPNGAFYVYVDCSMFTDDSHRFVYEVLDGARVAITPGIDFGSYRADQFVRFSYTNSLDKINEALDRLATFLVR